MGRYRLVELDMSLTPVLYGDVRCCNMIKDKCEEIDRFDREARPHRKLNPGSDHQGKHAAASNHFVGTARDYGCTRAMQLGSRHTGTPHNCGAVFCAARH